jgi:hypothetical protein
MNTLGSFQGSGEAIMSKPIRKEFGPGYDYPNRKFHIFAVILPTILIIALAVIMVRRVGAPSSKVQLSPVVACPTQTCPPASTEPASTEPASTAPASPAPSAKKTSASALSATPVLSLTGAMLSRVPSAVTHAVVLSSA